MKLEKKFGLWAFVVQLSRLDFAMVVKMVGKEEDNLIET